MGASAVTAAGGKAPLVTGPSCLGMLAVGLNGTAIMAALPTIRRDLALDAGEVVWAVNAYLIASAACIILGGKTADRTGARGVAACGLLLFTLASAVIATAEAPPWLLMGRWTGAECSRSEKTPCSNRSPLTSRSAF